MPKRSESDFAQTGIVELSSGLPPVVVALDSFYRLKQG
jgi:hypothetical protein